MISYRLLERVSSVRCTAKVYFRRFSRARDYKRNCFGLDL